MRETPLNDSRANPSKLVFRPRPPPQPPPPTPWLHLKHCTGKGSLVVEEGHTGPDTARVTSTITLVMEITVYKNTVNLYKIVFLGS